MKNGDNRKLDGVRSLHKKHGVYIILHDGGRIDTIGVEDEK